MGMMTTTIEFEMNGTSFEAIASYDATFGDGGRCEGDHFLECEISKMEVKELASWDENTGERYVVSDAGLVSQAEDVLIPLIVSYEEENYGGY